MSFNVMTTSIKVLCPIFVVLGIVKPSLGQELVDSNQSEMFNYLGFGDGDYGWGVNFGQPMSIRYQQWTRWNRALVYDVGYQISDQYVVGSANYLWYFLNESDRWRKKNQTGLILYRGSIGIVGGAHVGEKEDQKLKIGVKTLGGFEYLFPKSSWSIFIDLGPAFFISGNHFAEVGGGLGLTYYLNKSGASGVRGDKDPFKLGKSKKRRSKKNRSSEASSDDEDEDFLGGDDRPKRKKSKKKKRKKRSKKKATAQGDDDDFLNGETDSKKKKKRRKRSKR